MPNQPVHAVPVPIPSRFDFRNSRRRPQLRRQSTNTRHHAKTLFPPLMHCPYHSIGPYHQPTSLHSILNHTYTISELVVLCSDGFSSREACGESRYRILTSQTSLVAQIGYRRKKNSEMVRTIKNLRHFINTLPLHFFLLLLMRRKQLHWTDGT